MKLRLNKITLLLTGIVLLGSCKSDLNINRDPDRIPDSQSPIAQVLTSAEVTLGFEGGSDLFRYGTLIMQQMSGAASQPNQTYEYYRHNIAGSDLNNVWGSIQATTLQDLETIIKQAGSSPYYTGIAKVLKAYEMSLVVDAWGDVPYSEAQQLTSNTQPHYDDDATIYPKLITLLTDALTDLNAATSVLVPGSNSVIFGAWSTATRDKWIRTANTLRLRLLLHYSKTNPSFAVSQITTLVNSGALFLSANSDNFSAPFFDIQNARNPISQFEVSRANYLFADRFMVEMMLAKNDPRIATYFAIFPFDFVPFSRTTSAASFNTTLGTTLTFSGTTTGITTGMTVVAAGVPPYTIVKSVTPNTTTGLTTVVINDDETTGFGIPTQPSGTSVTFTPAYRGVSATKQPLAANNNYSRIHTFLRGAVVSGAAAPAGYTGPVQPFSYTGAAPQRMITFAEYNFIRAEAALMGAPGVAQTFFQAGITASMQEAGMSPTDIANYIAANGTLSGTTAQQLKKIIEEKYIALFGVSMEPWTDWRRTGYPVLSVPSNSITGAIPRSLFYPQSEIDLNPNAPAQKPANLQSTVFWDN